MANLKWGSTSAIFALCISILLGAVFGVGVGHIIVRALIFSVVFFGLGFGLRFILDTFFPEVLFANEETVPPEYKEGEGHVSIALDGTGEYAVPELFNKQGSGDLGNIEDLISGVYKGHTAQDDFDSGGSSEYPNFSSTKAGEGIDRKKKAGYNDLGDVQDDPFLENADEDFGGFQETSGFEKPEVNKPSVIQPQFTPSFGDDSGLGGLPDLDMMAMAFSSNYSGVSAPSAPSVSSAPAIHPVEEYEPDRSQYKGNKPQTLQGDFDAKSLAQGIRTVLNKS